MKIKIELLSDLCTCSGETYNSMVDMDVVYDDFRLLGDIYISYEKAIEQAELYNHSVKREVFFLATHGILHLLGYDHMEEEDEKVMFGKQNELLDGYGITRESK